MRNEELIVAHLEYARRIASSIGNQQALHFEDSDLQSEALYGLVRSGERFDPQRGVPFKGFVRVRIAGQLQEWLSARNQTPFGVLLDVHQINGEARAHESVKRREVRAAVETLPSRWRLVLSLRFWYGFTQNETAKRLNIGACRVGQIQRQAFARLRDVLENV